MVLAMDPIFKSACRACLSRDEVRESSSSQEAPGHMYTLQDSAVRDLFMECTSISVSFCAFLRIFHLAKSFPGS